MMNLKKLLTTPFQRQVSKGFIIFLIVIAGLGFADATYLTIEHFTHAIPPCSIGGCETVLTSAYSEVAGIPDSLLGSIYYLIILVLLIVYLDTKKETVLKTALAFTAIGFLVSLFLLIVQAFILHAYCLYCLGSALTSTILFVTSVVIFKKHK